MKRSALCPTPPIGWNSWNTFTENISEELVLSTADTMVESGLLAAGYEYLVIDGCWSLKERDAQGNLVADPAKFPHGMKYVADYVHNSACTAAAGPAPARAILPALSMNLRMPGSLPNGVWII